MARVYKMEEGDLQYRFQGSRAKIQLFGGGYGNGKTTSAVVKALGLARDYPGSNGLLARSTYPKLNDTLRKEFLNWCPTKWIAGKNLSQDNVVTLTNGSVINFRYIAQQGKSNESSTSNLLSATFDYIVVDQIEDPEIVEKDFLDLLGRLRGNTPYKGDDATMPRTGPRWFIACCNPTRNWVYRKLVKPLHDAQAGIKNPDLLVNNDGSMMIELFEGSTYSNAKNLPADFIETQEKVYSGQMRSRYLMGEWGAFEGLVYPQYQPMMHVLSKYEMGNYLRSIVDNGFRPTVVEAYDHGIAAPACYGLAVVDFYGNVFLYDGFHEKELPGIDAIADKIKRIRRDYLHDIDPHAEFDDVIADPAVFKRAPGKKSSVTTAGMFEEAGIDMVRANNDIMSGLLKVQTYLTLDKSHQHPILQTVGSPRFFVSGDLSWFDTEIVDYYWKKDSRGEYEDVPNDRNDHAMDMIKYLLASRPRIAGIIIPKNRLPPVLQRWTERAEAQSRGRSIRHAA